MFLYFDGRTFILSSFLPLPPTKRNQQNIKLKFLRLHFFCFCFCFCFHVHSSVQHSLSTYYQLASSWNQNSPAGRHGNCLPAASFLPSHVFSVTCHFLLYRFPRRYGLHLLFITLTLIMMITRRIGIWLIYLYIYIFGKINFHAVAVLRSLKDQWQNTPPSWSESDDPCGAPWEGITCNNNSRVTQM